MADTADRPGVAHLVLAPGVAHLDPELVAAGAPITHAVLDHHGTDIPVEHLRSILLHTGAIQPRGNAVDSLALPGPSRRGTVPAHLFAYQLEYGVIPRLGWSGADDAVLCHQCDFAGCTNPTHMRLGTNAVNRTEYRLRRRNLASPLSDVRGPAGRAPPSPPRFARASPSPPRFARASPAAKPPRRSRNGSDARKRPACLSRFGNSFEQIGAGEASSVAAVGGPLGVSEVRHCWIRSPTR
nr:hypothetical protein GCM10017611_86160 [Rhodococcus wratislaviensis]